MWNLYRFIDFNEALDIKYGYFRPIPSHDQS